MDLTRTRRALLASQNEDYHHADQLLDALDIVYEDAQESFEDQMRIHQQAINTSDVTAFVARSAASLLKKLLEVSDTETLLSIIIDEDREGIENAFSNLRHKLDEEKADREHWAKIGLDLGDLDDHPF